jgi:hypothetical protein
MQADAKPSPAAPGKNLPVVEAVGCLVSDAAQRWTLRQSGKPLPVRSQATSQADIAAAADRPPGTQSYVLLGLSVFDPQNHAGQRVAVRGVLISGAQAPRLNVTSLQPLNGSCH